MCDRRVYLYYAFHGWTARQAVVAFYQRAERAIVAKDAAERQLEVDFEPIVGEPQPQCAVMVG